MLTLQTNKSSLNAQRIIAANELARTKSTERLASGSRINSGGDDAAGLAIGNRMSAQVRSLNQVVRNMNDGASLARTADAALVEVSQMLLRARELATQAANEAVLTGQDRAALQTEVAELLEEIDRIAGETSFNGIKLLDNGIGGNMVAADPDKLELLLNLKTSWLEQAEKRITDFFGVTADGVDLQVVFKDTHDGAGSTIAFVTTSVGASGQGTVDDMTFDMEDYDPALFGDFDRIVTHELTHAVMARTSNWGSMQNSGVNGNQKWFIEGTAEFIHGADARLAGDLAAAGGGAAGADNIADALSEVFDGSSRHYSAGYAAVAFLHSHIINVQGNNDGIKALFDHLEADPANNTLDSAFAAVTGFANEAAFINDFKTTGGAGSGSAFIQGMNLANADTGSVAGSDADHAGVGNPSLDAQAVIPDTPNFTEDPTVGFNEIFPVLPGGQVTETVTVQAGVRAGQTLDVRLAAADTISLGIDGIDLAQDANSAMTKLDLAIDFLNSQRTNFGAMINRFEHAIASVRTRSESTAAARSRIRDTDFAQETTRSTRAQIVSSSAASILLQANQAPQVVLQLLAA